MKKLFTLLVLALGIASCQTEPEGLDVVVGGEQDVMLDVSLLEDTRATSSTGFDFTNFEDNDQYDLRFILEISYNDTVVRNVKTSETTSTSFPIRLIAGREYTFTVWADLVKEGTQTDLFYDTTKGLDEIEVITKTDENEVIAKKWTPNVEARDAFTHTLTTEFTATTKNLAFELKRPFAKVRVVATDIEDVRRFGIEPTKGVVTYKDVYTSFNATTGEVGGLVDNYRTTLPYDISSQTYDDLSDELTVLADYIFIPATSTVQFTLDIMQGNDTIKSNNFNTAIPVVRNKVTSIAGGMLTENGDVSITVGGELGVNETINYVDSAYSLQKAINKVEDGIKTTIKLGDDIVVETATTRAENQYGIVIPANKVIVLDLNGKSIRQSKAQYSKYALIENNGTLTIINSANTNGVISYRDHAPLTTAVGYASNTIQNNGVLTINEGVTLLNTSIDKVATYGYPHVIDTNGTLTINGGTLTNEANYSTIRIWTSNTDQQKCNVTIEGGTFNGCIDFQAHNNNSSTIPHFGMLVVKGGTFNADTFTKSAIRVLRFASNANDMHALIQGGNFNGKVWVRNFSTFDNTPKIINITGGTFTTTAKDGSYDALAEGYNFFEDGNGNWVVRSAGY